LSEGKVLVSSILSLSVINCLWSTKLAYIVLNISFKRVDWDCFLRFNSWLDLTITNLRGLIPYIMVYWFVLGYTRLKKQTPGFFPKNGLFSLFCFFHTSFFGWLNPTLNVYILKLFIWVFEHIQLPLPKSLFFYIVNTAFRGQFFFQILRSGLKWIWRFGFGEIFVLFLQVMVHKLGHYTFGRKLMFDQFVHFQFFFQMFYGFL
jgi:hypothetical protein